MDPFRPIDEVPRRMVFPFEQLSRMRPNWTALEAAAVVMLPAGGDPVVERSDATAYLLVLEGRVEFSVGSQPVLSAEAGEMLWVRAGDRCEMRAPDTNSVVLRVAEKLHPPFREAILADGAPGPVALPPTGILPSPRRRGVSVRFEPDATFQPAPLTREAGADVLLRAHPGQLSAGQAREYRNVCRSMRKSTLALSLEATDRDVRGFFHDKSATGNMELLWPLALSMEADPTTHEGRARIALMQSEWLPFAAPDGMRLCIEVTARPWNDEELRALFMALMEMPPAHWGVILRWRADRLGADFRARRNLEALLPWLHAVEYRGDVGVAEFAHYLDGLGFQGWLVTPAAP